MKSYNNDLFLYIDVETVSIIILMRLMIATDMLTTFDEPSNNNTEKGRESLDLQLRHWSLGAWELTIHGKAASLE